MVDLARLKFAVETGELKQAQTELKKLEKAGGKTEKATNRLGMSFKSLIVAAGGLYLVKQAFDGITAAASSFTKTAAQFEQYETTLKTITGSAIKAKESMSWIEDFTSKTPYQLNQVTESFVKLKAYGIEPTNGMLRTLGDTASGMGKPIMQAVEAMADAMTGENERLKEFGLKARLLGEQIGYAWTDSSGRTRNIIIENNRKIIQSTLSAIFNEKYAGAMKAQSRTWNGIISNMSDKWTSFKKNIMDAGLFAYLKGLAQTISDGLGSAFSTAEGEAKGFADSVINGIESIIGAVGVMNDTWSLFSGVFLFLETAFWQLVSVLGTGMNTIQSAWVTLSNAMSTIWATMANGIKAVFASAINSIIDGINAVSGMVNSAASKVGMGEIFGTIGKVSFEQTKANIQGVVKPIADVDAAMQRATASGIAYTKSFEDFANGDGQKRAASQIDAIRAKTEQLAQAEKNSITDKEKYKKVLDDIGAGYGELDKQAKKAAKSGGGGGAAKQIKADLKAAKKEAEKFTSSFTSLIDKMLSGDWTNLFGDFFSSIGKNLMQPFIKDMSTQLSKMISDFSGNMKGLGGFAIGAGISLAGSLIGSLFSNEVSQAEIDAAKGKVDFSDDSISNLQSAYESVMYPMTKINQDMRRYLRNMDANFYSVARAMGASATSGGIDLTGANFVETEDVGFLGFSSKSISLIGTGLKFAVMDLGEAMNAAELSVQSYTTTLVKKSSFWGLFKSSKISETYKDLPLEVIDDMAGAFASGYEAILTSGVALGLNQSNLRTALENAKIDLGKIDFTGLSQEEIANRLEQAYSTAFSGVIDGIGELSKYTDRYAKANEAALETLGRLALEVDQSTHMFNMIGTTFKTLGDYTAQMQQLDIVASTGGIQQFSDAMSSYMTNFFTESEQLGFQTTSMTEAFSTLNLALPESKDGFKDLLNGIDRTTEEGNYLYGQVLLLADGFATMTDASERLGEEAANASSSMLDAYKDLRLGSLSTLSLVEKAAFATEAFRNTRDSGTLVGDINNMLESQRRSDSDYYAYKAKENEALARLQENITEDKDKEIVNKLEESVARLESKLDDLIGATYERAVGE